jgi:hypothetical protein
MKPTLFLLVLLCAAPAVLAQEPTPTPNFPPVVEAQQTAPTPDWLHPSDAEYKEALDDGYNAETAKEALERYTPIELWPIQKDPDSSISIESPLHCAAAEAFFAAKDLADEPIVEEVKQICDGLIGVYVLHFSPRLHANWPVVLQHKNTVYQPHSRRLAPAPKVKRYIAGTGTRVAGYMYDDAYTFKPEEAWTDEATVTWTDDDGARHSKIVDFSTLAREEARLRSGADQNP